MLRPDGEGQRARDARTDGGADPHGGTDPHGNVAQRRRREGRIVWLALCASAVVHLAVLQIRLPTGGMGGGAPEAGTPEFASAPGMRVVNLSPVPSAADAESPRLDEPDPSVPPPEPATAPAPALSPAPAPPPAPASAPASPPSQAPTPDAVPAKAGPERPTRTIPAGAAGRLRRGLRDPRLFAPASSPATSSALSPSPAPVERPALGPPTGEEVEDRLSTELGRALAEQSSIAGPDSLLFSTWGDESTDGTSVRPGVITLGGVSLPFCGGTDASRCGFGARPWDLAAADQWRAFLEGIEDQGRWEDVQDRARRMRGTAGAVLDTVRSRR